VLAQSPSPISIRAARVLDGRGGVLTDAVIEITGSKITKIEQRSGPVTYDLSNATVLPGLIDVHVHFLAEGALLAGVGQAAELRAAQQTDLWQKSARATLLAGFTTVQSVGDAPDKALRDAIAAGLIIGPRLLTSIDAVRPGNRSPDELRAQVQKLKSQGADLIKLYGSASGFQGGAANVTLEQMTAVCGEARVQGLRSVVHAIATEAVTRAVKAGCAEIEHGSADDEAIKAVADANVFFDPTMSWAAIIIEHKDEVIRMGRMNETTIATLESGLPVKREQVRKALAAGLRMPNGSDIGYGHGENALEIVMRVEAGQKPMDAIIGATSLAAESLGLDKTIGTLAAGYEADVVAVPGNPLDDVAVLRNVTFVMKGGQIYKH
jgi:imidazolonepropionase-like amidohydrolase